MELSLLANCLLSSIELIISLCPLSIKKKSHIHVFVIFHQRLIIKKEKIFVIFDLLTFSDSFDNN